MDIYGWVVILGTALIPTVGYTIYIRNIEKYLREEWRWIGLGYLWGIFMALPFIYILAYLFSGQYLREHEYYELASSTSTLIFLCIILPFVGEFIKVTGMFNVKSRVDEVEDGLIHGATIGLGFAACVNIFYLHQGFSWDPKTLVLLIIPTISTALLHASSTAVTGYGVARQWVFNKKFSMIVYFLAGVLIHGLFNAFSLVNFIFRDTIGYAYYLLGLVIILLISNVVFRTIRARMLKFIKILDEETEIARRLKEQNAQ